MPRPLLIGGESAVKIEPQEQLFRVEDQRTPTEQRSFQLQQAAQPSASPCPLAQPRARRKMDPAYLDQLCAQYEWAAPASYYSYAGGESYDYGSATGVYDAAFTYGMAYDPSYGYYDASYGMNLSQLSGMTMAPIATHQTGYIPPAYSTMTPTIPEDSHLQPQSMYMSPQPSTHLRSSISAVGSKPTPSGQMSDSDLSSASTRSHRSTKSVRSLPASSATKDKRFVCPVCSEGFARNFNLKSHIACKHDNEKPFECNVCPKTFSRKHDTARHLAARHGYNQSDAQAEVQRRYPAGSGSLSN